MTAKNTGGRPRQIDDGPLFNRRDSFVRILSAAWGDVGWELSQASTTENLRDIFIGLNERFREDCLRPVVRDTKLSASSSDIRQTRQGLREVVKRMYQLDPQLNARGERLRQAQRGLLSASTQNFETILDETFLCLSSFRCLKGEMEKLEKQQKDFEKLQAGQEASYAQSELLRFIRRGKYAHDPYNVACAMAGLPEIGFWQSFQRCEKQESSLWPNRSYQVFQIIKLSWSRGQCDSNSAFLDLLLQRIKNLPRAKKSLRDHLMTNWRYLRLAAEQTDFAADIPKPIPYRVFSQFMKNIVQPRSSDEETLAGRENREISSEGSDV